jgi:hypothetical protein
MESELDESTLKSSTEESRESFTRRNNYLKEQYRSRIKILDDLRERLETSRLYIAPYERIRQGLSQREYEIALRKNDLRRELYDTLRKEKTEAQARLRSELEEAIRILKEVLNFTRLMKMLHELPKVDKFDRNEEVGYNKLPVPFALTAEEELDPTLIPPEIKSYNDYASEFQRLLLDNLSTYFTKLMETLQLSEGMSLSVRIYLTSAIYRDSETRIESSTGIVKLLLTIYPDNRMLYRFENRSYTQEENTITLYPSIFRDIVENEASSYASGQGFPEFILMFYYRVNNPFYESDDDKLSRYRKMLAFKCSSNKKFLKMCNLSIQDGEVCIYETFISIFLPSFSNINHNTSKGIHSRINLVRKSLSSEPEEIQYNVTHGHVIKSLELLTSKYQVSVRLFIFAKHKPDFLNAEYLTITNGIITEDLLKNAQYIPNKHDILLSEEDHHVSRYTYPGKTYNCFNKFQRKTVRLTEQQIYTTDKFETHYSKGSLFTGIEATPGAFIRSVIEHKKAEAKRKYTYYYWDIETAIEDGKHIPVTVCVIPPEDNPIIFYGLDCIKQFVQYVRTIVDRSTFTKSKKTSKLYHRFIAHNGSKFDMLFIHMEMLSADFGCSSFDKIIKENSIVYMKIGNVDFIDSYKLTSTSLREASNIYLGKDLKDYFPYNFLTLHNLGLSLDQSLIDLRLSSPNSTEYNGPIPPEQYWESSKYTYYDEKECTISDRKLFIHSLQLSEHEDARLIPSDYNPQYNFNLKQIMIDYCVNDVKVLKAIMTEYYRLAVEVDGKRTLFNITDPITLPSASLLAWKQTLPTSFKLYAPPEYEQRCASISYSGGATLNPRMFFDRKYLPLLTMEYVDYNSKYPDVMTRDIPTEHLSTTKHNPPIIVQSKLVDHYLYRAHITHHKNLPEGYVPFPPIKSEDGGLRYVLNPGEVWEWGVTLNPIMEYCTITIHETIAYKAAPIFRSFITYLYDNRLKWKNVVSKMTSTIKSITETLKTTDRSSQQYISLSQQLEQCRTERSKADSLQQKYKLMMNSLYGKFGQKLNKQTDTISEDQFYDKIQQCREDIQNLDCSYDHFEYNDKIFYIFKTMREHDRSQSIGQFVHIASFITSSARSDLLKAMKIVGFNNVYYFDTDSLFYTHGKEDPLITNNMIHSSKLGMLKKEEPKGIDKFYAIGPKMYYYQSGNKIVNKIKGIKTSLISESNFISLISTTTTLKSDKLIEDIHTMHLSTEKIPYDVSRSISIGFNDISGRTFNFDKLWRRDLFSTRFDYNTSRMVSFIPNKRKWKTYLYNGHIYVDIFDSSDPLAEIGEDLRFHH